MPKNCLKFGRNRGKLICYPWSAEAGVTERPLPVTLINDIPLGLNIPKLFCLAELVHAVPQTKPGFTVGVWLLPTVWRSRGDFLVTFLRAPLLGTWLLSL